MQDSKNRRKQDIEQEAAIKAIASETAAFKSGIEEIRTRLGTRKESGPPEFFTTVEMLINLATIAAKAQGLQLKQVGACSEYVDRVLDDISELRALIQEIKERVLALEEARKERAIIVSWLTATRLQIAGWASVAMLIAGLYAKVTGLIV